MLGALGLGLFLIAPLQAAFTGNYALGNFSLINNNADGSVLTPDGGLSIVLTGGNNGSGLFGTTDLIAPAAASGTVQFQYSYSSLDMPGADEAGYLVGGVYTQLADTSGQSGTAMFQVNGGQLFGFRMVTQDNTMEPGILTVSNFSAPSSAAGPAVPEPATGPLMFALAGAAIAVRLLRRPARRRERSA